MPESAGQTAQRAKRYRKATAFQRHAHTKVGGMVWRVTAQSPDGRWTFVQRGKVDTPEAKWLPTAVCGRIVNLSALRRSE